MASIAVIHVLFASLVATGFCNEFLKATPRVSKEFLDEDSIRTTLLEEVEGSLGAGSVANRLALFESALSPLYRALPKNEHSRLGHSGVRYALHRFFVQRHGWNINGLRAEDAFRNSSPAGVLQDQVPAYIQDLFEKRLGGKGFGLHELAVLAATIEHLIHNDTIGKLVTAFNIHSLLPTSILDDEEADDVIDTYMMGFVLGMNVGNMSFGKVTELKRHMPDIFTGWEGAQNFVRSIRKNVTSAESNEASMESGLNFATLTRVAEILGEEYGSFQNLECQELKKSLVEMEYRNTGRVRLADFYKPALNGSWQFQESRSYLRQLGALDESDLASLSVVIPNYLHSQTNCIASSGFFSVCCKDECEALLGHLEEQISAPFAKPSVISALITNLASSTTSVPRALSPALLGRLEDIAAHHGGTIPLHGRLFGQWLHHAYPRECPFPHMSGTTNQQTAEDWSAETGGSSEASMEEMLQFTTMYGSADMPTEDETGFAEDLLPWSSEEELLIVHSHTEGGSNVNSIRPIMRSFMLIAAACSLALGLVQSFKFPMPTTSAVNEAKFVV